MKTIPKLLTFMALLSIINFAHADSPEDAYKIYRKNYDINKNSPNTASALTALENDCEASCGGENCKNEKDGKECSMYCGYISECSVAQGLKRGQAPYKAHLTSLGITDLDDNDIPKAPLPQEPSVASKSLVSDKQANGASPTEVIIRVVVDNPSAASCKPVVIGKEEASQSNASVHSIARPLAASSPQHQEVTHSQPPAVVTTEASPLVEEPITAPQPVKPVCTAEMKRRRQCQ